MALRICMTFNGEIWPFGQDNWQIIDTRLSFWVSLKRAFTKIGGIKIECTALYRFHFWHNFLALFYFQYLAFGKKMAAKNDKSGHKIILACSKSTLLSWQCQYFHFNPSLTTEEGLKAHFSKSKIIFWFSEYQHHLECSLNS